MRGLHPENPLILRILIQTEKNWTLDIEHSILEISFPRASTRNFSPGPFNFVLYTFNFPKGLGVAAGGGSKEVGRLAPHCLSKAGFGSFQPLKSPPLRWDPARLFSLHKDS